LAQLLILADDFTGAMDTGVQFAKLGIKTLVGTDLTALLASAKEAEVLVIDTESRHMPPAEAYQAVYRQALTGREAGIVYLYKKTDSALRGNVGAELAAALQAWGGTSLPFVPAYPKMGRTTKNGVHYIGGVPVAESAFSRDPFSPVHCSDIVHWLLRQSCVPVVRAGAGRPKEPFIEVYDAQTDGDLQAIAESLRDAGRLSLLAGCAGLASVLPQVLHLAKSTVENVRSTGRLLVLCGSVHPVTKEQIRCAAGQGFCHIRLTPMQKLGKDEQENLTHRALLDRLTALCRGEAPIIIDANDEGEETLIYARAQGMTLADVRSAISASLGRIGKELLLAGVDSTMLITGGDTLMGFLAACQKGSLRPVCELMPGVVRAIFELGGKTYDIITKSGGFGEKHLLKELAEQMNYEKGETL
jgi:D-threonate/D-erythronate kinase